jgi:putative oxidoreductase
MNLARLICLEFLPRSVDAGLLVLRVWLGLTMLINHGWQKAANFRQIAEKFPDPLSFGQETSLALAVFAETACSLLLIAGFITRIAVLPLMITMAVAFVSVHKSRLAVDSPPPGSGELAFIYLAAFVCLFIAGPGRYSLDERRAPAAGPAPAV